ncbi:MaoC family dehydratase [Thermodesulfobacteriota bacterium]
MSKKKELLYDTFYIGQKIPRYTHTVTAEEIDNFCQNFKENTPVYLADDAAKENGFPGRIAPPMMVRFYAHIQNVLTGFGGIVSGHSIQTSGEYEFLDIVRPGDTITTTGKIVDKYIKKQRKYICFELVSRNQHGEKIVVNRHTSIWPK